MSKSLHRINKFNEITSDTGKSSFFSKSLYNHRTYVKYSFSFSTLESVLVRILNYLAISFFCLLHLVNSFIMFTYSVQFVT